MCKGGKKMYDLQKASMWKRISAFLFDGILVCVLAALAAFALSAVLGYDGYADTVNAAYDRYGEEYGVDLRMSMTEYSQLDEEGVMKLQAAYDALNADSEASHAYGMMMELSILIISFGFLASFLALEVIVPMAFGNGQTLGKKIFGIALMHTNMVRVRTPMLFARTILGKFAVETMVPAYIILMLFFGTIGSVGLIVLGLYLLLQLIVLIATHTNSAIHDLLAKTAVVDMGSQMIFETEKELMEYKKRIHEEKVSKAAY